MDIIVNFPSIGLFGSCHKLVGLARQSIVARPIFRRLEISQPPNRGPTGMVAWAQFTNIDVGENPPRHCPQAV